MTASARTVAPRRGWLRIALIASVALNLLLIGAAGAAIVRIRFGPPMLSSYSTNLFEYVGTLPHARRQAIWTATREERRSLRPLRAEVREARQAWREALAAEPFDRERFAAAQARVLEAETRTRAEAQRFFLQIASQLTPEERRAFLKWRPSDGRGHRKWWRERGGDDEPGLEAQQPLQTKQP